MRRAMWIYRVFLHMSILNNSKEAIQTLDGLRLTLKQIGSRKTLQDTFKLHLPMQAPGK